MTKYSNDTRKNFSRGSNFLVDYGPPIRVMCLRCKQWCEQIPLPNFTMYYCTEIHCTNTLELRHMLEKDTWELHDYATLIEEMPEEKAELLTPPQGKFVPRIVK